MLVDWTLFPFFVNVKFSHVLGVSSNFLCSLRYCINFVGRISSKSIISSFIKELGWKTFPPPISVLKIVLGTVFFQWCVDSMLLLLYVQLGLMSMIKTIMPVEWWIWGVAVVDMGCLNTSGKVLTSSFDVYRYCIVVLGHNESFEINIYGSCTAIPTCQAWAPPDWQVRRAVELMMSSA